MPSVNACAVPENSFLDAYQQDGGYADCYCCDVAGTVTQAQFVAAFYTTRLFGLERFILRWAIRRPSTDQDAHQLAAGALDRFAAWTVERRGSDQLLLCDLYGRTRSWLSVAPQGEGTRLYFGSAVVPKKTRSGDMRMGALFSALLGFHRAYSVALLRAAVANLR